MGCDPAHNGEVGCPNDVPLHTVYLDAFTIDKFEVTNAEYQKCELALACPTSVYPPSRTHSDYYNNPEFKYYPVINLNWYVAASYFAWVGEHLPSEAKWESAARGAGEGRAFPWGDRVPDCGLANAFGLGGATYCVGDPIKGGSYPAGASLASVFDLAGNVWEWVNDWHQDDYYRVSPYANPPGPAAETFKVLRGGAFSSGDLAAYDTGIGFRFAGGP
jgi:formylglycine-generating enzyme